jgi:hypothetical protein
VTCATVAGSVSKAPAEVLDFVIAWTLPTGDSLSTATCTAESGDVVVDDCDVVSNTVVVWVSAGTCGSVSELLVTVTTAAGRTLQRSVYVEVRR